MNVLEVKEIKKSFGNKKVLDGVSFSVPENCIFGFIGRNGAGKTTTMRSILGLLKTDGGEINVCGERVSYGCTPKSGCIGYLPDVPDPDLIIRPSGEQRISNFLLCECAYSEFWISDVLWPDFGLDELTQAFRDYTSRDRRFGGLSKKDSKA
jgi:ABC-type dipeptide/oligopeptide/nickel transport system ATPase component